MQSLINKAILFIFLSINGQVQAQSSSDLSFDATNSITLNYIIDTQIKEDFKFSGLAIYLNQAHYYVVDSNLISTLDRNNTSRINLENTQWLAVAGRYNVLLIKSQNTKISFNENQQLTIESISNNPTINLLNKSQLSNFDPVLDQIRYNHLWYPFAVVARWSEALLVFIKTSTSLNWGLSILLFALVIKIMLLPISLITTKSQQKVSKINSLLQPRLAEIKSKYKGEKAHHFSMKAHKDLGVSPFYALKPMLSFLIQIPILIAIFNALGEMPQLLNQSFAWFSDLSKPDMLLPLGTSIPFFGEHLNAMPVLMTLITLTSTILHKDNHASESDNKKQKLKLYLMAFGFFILFYPFPAAMVMYWAMANLLGFIQQKLTK